MITVVKNKRKNRKGNEIRQLNKIRPQDTFFVSKDITTRPPRLSRKDRVENFYLNKTEVIINCKHFQSDLTLKTWSKKPVKCHMETPFEEKVSDRLH